MQESYEKYAAGQKERKCRICGKTDEKLIYYIKEMMYGMEETFEYFLCPSCECLQITEVPSNLGIYYGETYYSYKEPQIKDTRPKQEYDDYYILDVGCGAGIDLCKLAEQGYSKLFGCDPFIEHDILYDNGVWIKKASIHEMNQQYDYINLGDSLEHMADPIDTFQSIKRLLKPKGVCCISIPVIPNIAFDTYGLYWFQLDAPRHLFLHSKKSINYLCEQAGLECYGMVSDSSNAQFVRSALYQKGYTFNEHTGEVLEREFAPKEWDNFSQLAEMANKMQYGDHAKFYIRHK